MNTNSSAEEIGLRVMSALYRAAAVDLLIRDYHWRGAAAERFAAQMGIEVVSRVERYLDLRRELATRDGHAATAAESIDLPDGPVIPDGRDGRTL